MLFFLLRLSVSLKNETCNATECDGHCVSYHLNGIGNVAFCLNDFYYYFTSYIGILYLHLLVFAPVFIFIVLSFFGCSSVTRNSICPSVMMSLSFTCIPGVIITSKYYEIPTFIIYLSEILIYISFLIGLFSNVYHGCDWGKNYFLSEHNVNVRNKAIIGKYSTVDFENVNVKNIIIDFFDVYNQINSPKVTFTELRTSINENMSIPPNPKMVLDYIDTEFHTAGTLCKTVDIKYFDIEYGSWQQEGELPDLSLDGKSGIIFISYSTISFDDDMGEKIFKAQYLADSSFDSSISHEYVLYPIPSVEGLTQSVLAYDKSCFIDCCTSFFCAKILYRILMMIGYSIIFDHFWLWKVKKDEFNISKKVSNSPSKLRVKAGERDNDFISQVDSKAINFNSNTPLKDPLLNL